MKLPDEAKRIVRAEADRLRALSHEELLKYLEPQVKRVKGDSGLVYQLEIEARWDDRKKQNLRVNLTIDDGRGFRFVMTPAEGFIVTPEGGFVGE